MAYEYTNKQACVVTVNLPFGRTIKVKPGECVPTPAHEQSGFTHEMFAPFVSPSFLSHTQMPQRRALSQATQAQAPEAPPVPPPQVVGVGGNDPRSKGNKELGDALQAAIDKKSSSHKGA